MRSRKSDSREGREREEETRNQEPDAGSKMAAGKARTDGPFLMLSRGSGEREKEKINIIAAGI